MCVKFRKVAARGQQHLPKTGAKKETYDISVNKINYVVSQKLSSSVVGTSELESAAESYLSEAVATILFELLTVSIGIMYQPDLFYLTMLPLFHAVKTG